MKTRSLYVILDKQYCKTSSAQTLAKALAENGVDWIQYRNKTGSEQEKLNDARQIAQVLKPYSVKFIVNDDPYLAKEVQADGVHLGEEDCSIEEARKILSNTFVIGKSTHSLEEALLAEKQGADYIAVGDLFGSQTKNKTQRTSLETFQAICQSVQIPAVGIGGITLENKEQVFQLGASAIALAKGIFQEGSFSEACRQFKG